MSDSKQDSGTIVDVQIVPELCMNFRNCLRIAAGGFVTDPATGKTRVALWQRVAPEELWKAAWSCPSGAIRLVTQEHGYVVPRWDEIAHWDIERHPAAGRKGDEVLPRY
jgi:ferredoxin